MYPFAPEINGVEALWSLLRIQRPGIEDAKTVLRKLSSEPCLNMEKRLVMLESLRILSAARPTQLGGLKRSRLWVGDRWERKRPVYAVANPLVAEALKGRIPIWDPGGSLGQVESLIEPLGLMRIDPSQSRVLDKQDAIEDPVLTRIYNRAVANMRADLALSDPGAEASLTVSWDDLAGYQICLLPTIRVQLAMTVADKPLTLDVNAWLETQSGTLYLTEFDAAGRLTSGAYAIAAVFTGGTRSIAHAWVVAWSEAHAGHEAEKVATAASEAAERRRQRDEADDARLREFAARSKQKRSRSRTGGKKLGDGDSAEGKPSVVDSPPLPTRNLIDTARLTIRGGDGTIINADRNSVTVTTRDPTKKPAGLKDPDPKNRKNSPQTPRRSPANYTEVEKEDAGMEVVRQVLGLDIEEMIDIRNQHNVGADAVDELRNFFELKVHAGDIPDRIRLQDSEVERAFETEDFFLVLVGNVEAGGPPTEVRVITDPLNNLSRTLAGHITLSGVRAAKSFQYFVDATGDSNSEA
jgi:hypothetical protein